jgi:hypothetical protein
MSARGRARAGDLPPGELQFHDNVLPPLPATDYLLEVTQDVVIPAKYGPPQAPFRHTQWMRVDGPHFGLGPTDVFSVYPPANSRSDYTETLANVVLGSRTLPWQISLGGATSGPVVAPWMAVLLLTPDEIVFPPGADAKGNLTGAQVVSLASYLAPPEAHVLPPAFTAAQVARFEAQYPELAVTVVDVAAEAFAAIAPAQDELPFLAHAREVSTDHQEILGTGADGWFSVVVGNRLPSTAGLYVAHLVSLEGFAGYLPGGAPLPPGTTAVRLISLASWTFTNLGSAGDFAAIMKSLSNDVLAMPPLVGSPQPGPEQAVASALAAGYTGVRYLTRLGEETVAWYRGPCLPVQMERNPQPLYTTAESALIYDREAGTFDVSFATAWQTGRLAALADRQLVIALLAWIRQNNHLAQLLAARLALFQEYGELLALPDDPGALLAPDLMRRATRDHLARRVAPMLSAAAPGARPLLGPPRDPSGLLRHLHHLPGVLAPEAWRELAASGADPTHELLARVRRGR